LCNNISKAHTMRDNLQKIQWSLKRAKILYKLQLQHAKNCILTAILGIYRPWQLHSYCHSPSISSFMLCQHACTYRGCNAHIWLNYSTLTLTK
jgi:hypothetical protein